MWFNASPVIELTAIFGMSSTLVGIANICHREGRVAIAFGVALLMGRRCCGALMSGA
jgi:hypothetical protein